MSILASDARVDGPRQRIALNKAEQGGSEEDDFIRKVPSRHRQGAEAGEGGGRKMGTPSLFPRSRSFSRTFQAYPF